MNSTIGSYNQCINGYMNNPGGYIRVINKGLYVAIVEIQFYVNGQHEIYRSPKLIKGKGTQLNIPGNARQIRLDTYYHSGVKYNLICTKFFDNAPIVCYELTGTVCNPQCKQVPCQSNNEQNGYTMCCCCCCCKNNMF
ncbi:MULTISPECIES: hypothetical protein [Clostridium]|uniref:Uncharacterized protein n=1 Tax=Clostridium botulinum D str. 1873 TaxID=592027 RepID=A0A9P2G6T0_CLOBO|nr:hypothetical protein [Clostridium botulinum]EES91081.1 hypothetical protein CLG_B1626 [Clostridium botulinum D str. 1873]